MNRDRTKKIGIGGNIIVIVYNTSVQIVKNFLKFQELQNLSSLMCKFMAFSLLVYVTTLYLYVTFTRGKCWQLHWDYINLILVKAW